MTNDDPNPPRPEHYELLSNAGRCDVCGKPIDMSSGDVFAVMEFGTSDGIEEETGITDQDAANTVADALEEIGGSGADYDLAETIRNTHLIGAHDGCLTEQTNFNRLVTEYDTVTDPGGRFEQCEECGGPVDTETPGHWKAPNDEQWWHERCYDE